MTVTWQVDSWQQYHAEQQPHYRDQTHLATVLQQLKQQPALVTFAEVMRLRAHVEYRRGISNAIGIKIDHAADPQEIVEIVHILNPNNDRDRIVLIARFGNEKVQALRPRFIAALQQAALNVIWTVDPMHGNTFYTAQGVKTRHCQHIAAEIQQSFTLHRKHGSRLNGVHLELSGDQVTECLGGKDNLQEVDLAHAYHTACDPRLNRNQSLEITQLVGELIATPV